MNSGVTAERVYDTLKRRLLHGEFRPGDRLDPALLSESLSSSVTPVRDVLHQLTGEGLVESRTGEGFHLPQVTEPDLRDRYQWNGQILALALRQRTGASPLPSAPAGNDPDAMAEEAASLFSWLARNSANAEHARAVASTNDRLHVARRVESRCLADVAGDLSGLRAAMAAGEDGRVGKLLSLYHRQRQRIAAEIVRAIYRDA